MRLFRATSAGVLLVLPLFGVNYYRIDIIAATGQAVTGAGSLTGMGNGPSVNQNGVVAFVGQFAAGEALVVGDGTNPLKMISFAPSATRVYQSSGKINDSNQVFATDRVTGPVTFARSWDANNPGAFTTYGKGDAQNATFPYDAVFTLGSINNNGDGVFGALQKGAPNTLLVTRTAAGVVSQIVVPPNSLLRPMIADNGNVVVKLDNLAASAINLYPISLASPITIADQTSFTTTGNRPGISDDGQIVVFYGDLTTPAFGTNAGPGIFASVNDPAGRKLIRLTGRKVEDLTAAGGNKDGVCDAGETCVAAPELGLDDAEKPITFASYDVSSRVAVTNLGLGAAGIDGDSFVVTFTGTPTSASRTNPQLPGTPLLFSNQPGVWSMRVDVRRELKGGAALAYVINGAIPVLQVGDKVGGQSITAVNTFDTVANAAMSAGAIRTQRRGDHQVALWAQTAASQMIVRGTQLDSDQDGLFDHWETAGIDMDQDGLPDLNLAAMGADPAKRDIFLEIDWLANQPGVTYRPSPGVISPLPGEAVSPLVAMFQGAPALSGNTYGVRSDGAAPANIAAGITLHVDGGPGNDSIGRKLSVNMGAGPLEGGDSIGMPGAPTAPVHLLYFGPPGCLSVPGSACLPLTIPGLNARAMTDVRRTFSGSADKDARELAFRYTVLGAFYNFTFTGAGLPLTGTVGSATAGALVPSAALPGGLIGGGIAITSGAGQGQLRAFNVVGGSLQVDQNWTTIPGPGDAFVVLDASSGRGETHWQPANSFHGFPGNDFVVTLRGAGPAGMLARCYQWRTIAHEMGHTLTLRHHGIEHSPNNDPTYLSLMSYGHQLNCTSPVNSYSIAGDPIFNDFADLHHGFANEPEHLGNTDGIGLGDVVDQTAVPNSIITSRQQFPRDNVLPVVSIASPAAGQNVSVGGSVPVSLTASDDQALARVIVEFDANGNGVIDEPSESITASNTGGNNFAASFPSVSGAAGQRTLRAIAFDASENLAVSEVSLNVIAGAAPAIASVSPNTGQQGQTLANVAIVGQNTHFLQGTTVANFGAGITINSLTVNSATSASANITVQPAAAPGSRTVTMTTGAEVAITAPASGFTVNLTGPLPPTLSAVVTHSGNFTQGQTNALYSIFVSNQPGALATSGVVTVTETVPTGITLVSMLGTGWTCPAGGTTCTRSDVLTGGSAYPAITVTVNVAANAAALVTNSVSVSGGGSATANATDPTTVTSSGGIGSGLRFVPVTPCRVADTRSPDGPFGGPAIAGGASRDFVIPSSTCGVPANAQAYSLNVAVVPGGPLGFVTLWPAGQARPVASTLNSLDGRVKSNAAIVPAGAGGAVSVFASNTTGVVLDINGYFVPASDLTALAFYPVTPCRIADTRGAAGSLAGPSLTGGVSRTFPILSAPCGIPATAKAYSLNFAAVPSGPLGFVTAWPTGQSQPVVASLNAVTGAITGNAAIVPAGTAGGVDIFASNTTDLVIDINGYFAPMATGGLSLYNVSPCRVLDSRDPAGTPPFSGKKDVPVGGGSCGVPAGAEAFVLSAAVVPPGPLGFLTLWPQGLTQPVVATLNALDGAVTSNLAIVPSANGSISAFASNPTHLILDVFGYFAP